MIFIYGAIVREFLYVTKFHYRKDFSLWFNMKSYYLYFLQKFRYQFAQYAG